MRKRLFVLGLIAALSAPGMAAAAAISFVSALTAQESQRYSLGFQFTTNEAVTVTSLGYYDDGGDGFVTQHEVGIFDAAGNLLTSTMLSAGSVDSLDQGFRYRAVEPVLLQAGSSFTIAATTYGPSDPWAYGYSWSFVGLSVDPRISIADAGSRYGYSPDDALILPPYNGGYILYAGPNFNGAVAEGAVPEPSSVGLVCAGLVLACCRRWRTSLRAAKSAITCAALLLCCHVAEASLLVTGTGGGGIHAYDENTGASLGQFFEEPYAPGEPNGLRGLVEGPDGNVYVSSSRRVYRISATGASSEVFATNTTGGFLVDIAFGPNGNLYALDRDNAVVQEYSGSTGTFVGSFPTTGWALGLLFNPSGTLFVADGAEGLHEYNGTTGAHIAEWWGISGAMAVGTDGLLYFATYGYVFRCSAPSNCSQFGSGGGPEEDILGLTFGPDGNLYATEMNSNRVSRYSGSTGAYLGSFASGGDLYGHWDLAFVNAPVPGPTVPEPGTLAVLPVALGALVLLSRRHRRTSNPLASTELSRTRTTAAAFLPAVLAWMLAPAAQSAPVTWQLQNVIFNDGGTANGSFVFDADLGYATAVSFTTTAGTLGTGYSYTTGSSSVSGPNPWRYNFYAGAPNILYSFSLWTSAPLTDAGGTVLLDPAFRGFERGDYSVPNQNIYFRGIAGGSLIAASDTSVPEPTTTYSFGLAAFVGLGWALRRRHAQASALVRSLSRKG